MKTSIAFALSAFLSTATASAQSPPPQSPSTEDFQAWVAEKQVQMQWLSDRAASIATDRAALARKLESIEAEEKAKANAGKPEAK